MKQICPFPNIECDLHLFKKEIGTFVCAGEMDCQNRKPAMNKPKLHSNQRKNQMELNYD
jgi:hypothetical protein